MITIYHLFIVLALLNILDIFLTLGILKGGGRELNPVMNYFFSKTSPLVAMVLLKGVVLGLVYYFLDLLPVYALWVAVLGYLGVVIWNAVQYRNVMGRAV